MIQHLTQIADFIIRAFLHIWPYLLITIPISVIIGMTGASRYIKKAFTSRPLISILLATAVGAFSPFCSCGVIPVIAALLMGGVPLAPVMSFWIASPSMDPEMFMLSGATLGWEMALWRLASTLLLSLSAGFITHYLWKNGWLGDTYIKLGGTGKTSSWKELIIKGFARIRKIVISGRNINPGRGIALASEGAFPVIPVKINNSEQCGCSSKTKITYGNLGCCDDPRPAPPAEAKSCCSSEKKETFAERLFRESSKATLMVIKFMLLAFFLEALIILYIPDTFISGLMGKGNFLSVLWGALIGVPVYTSNLSALPMIGALLQQGMNPGAGLAFLISGPVTTIPAMAAVKGLTTKKVFYLYVSFAFFGALFFGYLYSIVKMIF